MSFNLAQIVRRERNPQRSRITLRPIQPTGVQATGLYHAAYAPVITLWSHAADRAIAEYERSLSALVTDSAADLGRELDGADGEFMRLFLTLRPALNRWAILTELWHRGKWRGAVLSATGVDIRTIIGASDVRETLGAVIERNVALVKSVSDQIRSRISDAVFRGLTERRSARDVAKEIRESVDMGRRRALNIASDQMIKISAALDQERRREAGIDSWEWRHSGKKHPRANHVARNGMIYTDATAPEDLPGQLPYCGCTSRAVLRFD
ncbi:MAG: phage minor head protein [Pseudomonadota bacterium]